MKRPNLVSLFILSIIISTNLSAQHHSTSTLAYAHLYEVNKQWEKHQSESPAYEIQFDSDVDRIQFHLHAVVNYLSKNTPSHFSDKSLQNRFALLNNLKKYANDKIFPKNTHHPIRQPYFIDDEGTYCAVGYLMKTSDNGELAQQIKKEHNYDYIADIKTKGVTEWAAENGFLLDELAWIQPGYAPLSILSPLSGGTNGAVNVMYADNNGERLIFAGDFDLVDDLPCLNIGYYQEEQLQCLGNGLSGIINDIFTNSEGVVVIGQLNDGTADYPMAIFSDGEWGFIQIPGRAGAIGTTSFRSGNYSKEISISHSSIPNQQEIWYLNSAAEWKKKARVDGMILDIEVSQYGRAYVGHFNEITAYRPDLGDTTFLANNVVFNENYIDNWYSIGSEVSDTVKVVHKIGGAIYFGGTCPAILDENTSDVCLTRYYNGILQPLILGSSFSGNVYDSTTIYSINDIQLYQDDLILGGSFYIIPLVGTFGQNLTRYDLVHNHHEALANFDKPVNVMTDWQGDLYLGGDFTSNLTLNLGSQDLPHLAKTDLTVDILTVNENKDLQIFPNPVTNILNIKGLESSFEYKIYSLSGELINEGVSADYNIKLGKMAAGVYILNLKTEEKRYSLKFIKA